MRGLLRTFYFLPPREAKPDGRFSLFLGVNYHFYDIFGPPHPGHHTPKNWLCLQNLLLLLSFVASISFGSAAVRCQHFALSYYFVILEWDQNFTVYFAQHPLLALLAPPVGPVFLCALLPFVANGLHFSLVYCFVGSLIPGTLFCKPSALGTQRRHFLRRHLCRRAFDRVLLFFFAVGFDYVSGGLACLGRAFWPTFCRISMATLLQVVQTTTTDIEMFYVAFCYVLSSIFITFFS